MPTVDARAGRIYPQRQKQADKLLKRAGATPYNLLAKLALPVYSSILLRTAGAHVSLQQTAVACAIERFRLRNGEFPETLDALLPTYLTAPVRDVFSGESLRYKRHADGTYLLYSIGWNEVDDGGVIARTQGSPNKVQDITQGDWVWPFPAR